MRCKGCHKRPSQIDEYIVRAEEEDISPEEYVRKEEGTYNPNTGEFYCTDCYIKAGMPRGRA